MQCFDSVSPKTYSVYKLMNCEEGSVLQNQLPEHVITTEDENLKHGCDQTSLSYGPVFIILYLW